MGHAFCSLILLFSLAVPTVPNQVSPSPTKEALLVGDSVMAVLANNNPGLKLLGRQHPFILTATACQKLIYVGCTTTAKKSSLALLKANRGKFSKVVVVATGYNDLDNNSFARAIAAISSESSRQGVLVLWLTYREEGNVKQKAISYNAQLRKFSRTVPNLRLLDWNKISKGRDSWFTRDKIHMSGTGAFELAKAISTAIDNL
jgi:hypothetical protein